MTRDVSLTLLLQKTFSQTSPADLSHCSGPGVIVLSRSGGLREPAWHPRQSMVIVFILEINTRSWHWEALIGRNWTSQSDPELGPQQNKNAQKFTESTGHGALLSPVALLRSFAVILLCLQPCLWLFGGRNGWTVDLVCQLETGACPLPLIIPIVFPLLGDNTVRSKWKQNVSLLLAPFLLDKNQEYKSKW